MKTNQKKTREMHGKVIIVAFFLFLVSLSIWILLPTLPLTSAQTNTAANYSIINVTVNITNSEPQVSSVTLQTPINLVAYTTANVTCNATVFDWDSNVNAANASLYHQTANSGTADDKNVHYTSICVNISPIGLFTNYSCEFEVYYFANNGTWTCNVTASDSMGARASNISSTASLSGLVGIYVPGSIDYGDLVVWNTSATQRVNITNAGNLKMNFSILGYGVDQGDNTSLNCSYGTIGLEWERFSIVNSTNWTNMRPINSSTQNVNLSILQRTDDNNVPFNATYWALKIPSGVGGACNGYLRFEASETT